MAPGPVWKASVKEVNNGIDKAKKNLNTLVSMENIRQEIYSNPNTKVEVLVKTKQPRNKDWSSLLSDEHQSQKRGSGKKSAKRFAQPTKASQMKNLSHKVKAVVDEAAATVDEPDAVAKASHKFSNRTLQIFLKEMRLALKHDDGSKGQVAKILDDLEYVAANLDLDPHQGSSSRNADQLFDVSLYKVEAKKAKSDCEVLKRTVQRLEGKVRDLEGESKAKGEKVSELKKLVSSLSSNNKEMIELLSAKANCEDQLEALEKANERLHDDLIVEQRKYAILEAKSKTSESEINRLHKIIDDLKFSLNANLQNVDNIVGKDPLAVEAGPYNETTVDLALSTTEIESIKDDDDPDSALGAEGNSESQPVSGAASAMPILQPPMNLSSSFQPVPMNLSETRSSSHWSTSELPAEERPEEAKKYDINVDAKVAEFLQKMRNDERFQISLGSELLEKRKALPANETTRVTFNTDLESSNTLSESKFRQGLETSSFDVSDKEDNDGSKK